MNSIAAAADNGSFVSSNQSTDLSAGMSASSTADRRNNCQLVAVI